MLFLLKQNSLYFPKFFFFLKKYFILQTILNRPSLIYNGRREGKKILKSIRSSKCSEKNKLQKVEMFHILFTFIVKLVHRMNFNDGPHKNQRRVTEKKIKIKNLVKTSLFLKNIRQYRGDLFTRFFFNGCQKKTHTQRACDPERKNYFSSCVQDSEKAIRNRLFGNFLKKTL